MCVELRFGFLGLSKNIKRYQIRPQGAQKQLSKVRVGVVETVEGKHSSHKLAGVGAFTSRACQ